MKTLILKNGKDIDIKLERENSTKWFAKNNIQIEYEEREIDIPISWEKYKQVDGFSAKTGKPMQVFYMGLTDTVKDDIRKLVKEEEYDQVILINDISDIKAKENEVYSVNWTTLSGLYSDTELIQIVYSDYLKEHGIIESAFTHETMHAICFKLNRNGYHVNDYMDRDMYGRPYYRNDQPDDPTSNYGQTLDSIRQYIDKLVNKDTGYKYFTESEVKGLNKDFVLLLDKARGIAGIPFVINSGYRTVAHNKAVGGVANSSHLSGLAVDLRARNGAESYGIIKAAMEVGIKRIGINRKKNFIHLDIDSTKPSPTIYEY